MESVRIVVELTRGGRRFAERHAAGLAELFNQFIAGEAPPEVVFVPLVREVEVSEEELDALRNRAARLSAARDVAFDSDDWRFGGFLTADADPTAAARLSALLAARVRASSGIGDSASGLRLERFWLEAFEESPRLRTGVKGRPAGEIVDPSGTMQRRPGAQGDHRDVKLIVVEQSWRLDHSDLETGAIRELSRPSSPQDSQDAAHGVATLGVLVHGSGGVIPKIHYLGLLSPSDRWSRLSLNWTAAVLRALVTLDPGDVLLLEQQKKLQLSATYLRNFPPEVFPSVALAVGLGCLAGVIIVEPAGNPEIANAVVNFDDPTVVKLLKNGGYTPRIGLAGAILVGAASPDSCPGVFSNYGKRVDIFAPGRCIRTTGWWGKEVVNPNGYTGFYGLTSAAGAIVAGAIVVVQAVRRSAGQRPLLHWQMKRVIRDHGKTRYGLGVKKSNWLLADFVNDAMK